MRKFVVGLLILALLPALVAFATAQDPGETAEGPAADVADTAVVDPIDEPTGSVAEPTPVAAERQVDDPGLDHPATEEHPAAPAGATAGHAAGADAATEHDAAATHGDAGHSTAGHGDAGHGGGHGHDTTDLSHANAGPELASPMEWRFELTIATMVVFLLLLLLLGKFAWGPIAKGLDEREMGIANMIATAERNAKESELRLRELEARLAVQAEEAREVLSAARREGDVIREKMVSEARAAAQAETDRSLAEIRQAKSLALHEIAQRSVNTAVDLASNIIRREVRPEDHSALISDSLSKFQSNN